MNDNIEEEDLQTFDFRPLLSQNTSPDQIPQLRLCTAVQADLGMKPVEMVSVQLYSSVYFYF